MFEEFDHVQSTDLMNSALMLTGVLDRGLSSAFSRGGAPGAPPTQKVLSPIITLFRCQWDPSGQHIRG